MFIARMNHFAVVRVLLHRGRPLDSSNRLVPGAKCSRDSTGKPTCGPGLGSTTTTQATVVTLTTTTTPSQTTTTTTTPVPLTTTTTPSPTSVLSTSNTIDSDTAVLTTVAALTAADLTSAQIDPSAGAIPSTMSGGKAASVGVQTGLPGVIPNSDSGDSTTSEAQRPRSWFMLTPWVISVIFACLGESNRPLLLVYD